MRACCYARTSTLDQAREEKVSIPDQVNWARTFALERGWEWVSEYIEPGVTGDTEPEQREALNRLMQDAKDDKFDILLVYHSSRLAREPDIGMRVCRVLGQLRKQAYFRNAPIEPVDPLKFAWGQNIGAQYMTAFSFIGDFQENVARSERVRAGFLGLARRGVLVFAPYGYRKIPRITTDESGKQRYSWVFEVEPSEAIIVRRLFREYANTGGSLRHLMLTFNREKIPSPSGEVSDEAWSAATIRNILSNPAYIGKIRWGRKLGGKYLQGKSLSGRQRRVYTSVENWILTDGTHPKIIEGVDLFNRVQEKLKVRAAFKGRAIASKGLLTGLVICGRCGRKAYYKTKVEKRMNNWVRSYYVCQSYFTHKTCKRHVMGSPKLHDIVISELDKIASNPEYRKRLLEKGRFDKNNGLEGQAVVLRTELEEIRDKQKRILGAYENKVLSLEEFGEAKRGLDNKAISLLGEIEGIEKSLADTSMAEKARKRFVEVLENFKETFIGADFPKQKEIIQSLISSVVVVNSNRVKINYRL